MQLKIVQVGEPVLRRRARPISSEEIRSNAIRTLIEDMRETMYAAPGVGLAAPQVGVPLQLAVIEDREEWLKTLPAEQLVERERRAVPFHAIINPVIARSSDEEVEFFEGCLSLPGFSALVPRARLVRVECLDQHARPQVIEAAGWYARILQHEIDHLLGNIYVDRMRSRTFTSLDNFNQFWNQKPINAIREELSSRENSRS
ncbi:MAG TPA: peptide deformylase [Candidatus Cybelea sp.]|nr:peptide deformylase [Candidatus Cybelea sp.]